MFIFNGVCFLNSAHIGYEAFFSEENLHPPYNTKHLHRRNHSKDIVKLFGSQLCLTVRHLLTLFVYKLSFRAFLATRERRLLCTTHRKLAAWIPTGQLPRAKEIPIRFSGSLNLFGESYYFAPIRVPIRIFIMTCIALAHRCRKDLM